MIFVDTNIWIYYLDARLPEHQKVVQPLETAIKRGVTTSVIVLIEVAHYFGNLPRDDYWAAVECLRNLGTLEVVGFDESVLSMSLDLLARYVNTGIGGRDSIILASMVEGGISTIMTHDVAFKKIPFIEVTDPVED
jgi:predicted nucleic acid-binding protein